MGEDVRAGAADLLRVVFQPVRLCGHLRLHLRGRLVRGQGWLLRSICPESSKTAEDIQGKDYWPYFNYSVAGSLEFVIRLSLP